MSNTSLPPDVEAIFKKLFKLLETDGDQIGILPEPVRSEIAGGLDCDEHRRADKTQRAAVRIQEEDEDQHGRRLRSGRRLLLYSWVRAYLRAMGEGNPVHEQ